jgi:hypothetical protein
MGKDMVVCRCQLTPKKTKLSLGGKIAPTIFMKKKKPSPDLENPQTPFHW